MALTPVTVDTYMRAWNAGILLMEVKECQCRVYCSKRLHVVWTTQLFIDDNDCTDAYSFTAV